MPLFTLTPFPDPAASPRHTAPDGRPSLTVELVTGADGGLCLDYRIAAPELRIPPPVPPRRAEGLWQHTCCELFIARPGDRAYREFNFAPSGEWTVYDFLDYRQRAPGGDVVEPPLVEWHSEGPEVWRLRARVPAALLPQRPWQLALTAVLEDCTGQFGYWALTHAGERPDFHRRDTFFPFPDPQRP